MADQTTQNKQMERAEVMTTALTPTELEERYQCLMDAAGLKELLVKSVGCRLFLDVELPCDSINGEPRLYRFVCGRQTRSSEYVCQRVIGLLDELAWELERRACEGIPPEADESQPEVKP